MALEVMGVWFEEEEEEFNFTSPPLVTEAFNPSGPAPQPTVHRNLDDKEEVKEQFKFKI